MISKLPRWIEAGGFGLAANAGAVNAIGLLGFKHQTVSNLTGTSTRAGVALLNSSPAAIAHLFLILLSFLLGAVLAGFIVDNSVLRLGRRYTLILVIEAVLLLVAMVVLWHHSSIGYLLAAAACGLQNGMASTYSGAIVRTSHVTGLVTDLGALLGGRLRGHYVQKRKILLYVLLISGFIIGGSIGAYSFQHLQFTALAIPAATALSFAAVNWIYRHMSRRAHS